MGRCRPGAYGHTLRGFRRARRSGPPCRGPSRTGRVERDGALPSRQVVNEGVDVMLGTTFTPDLLDEFEPDILVIATGARQIVPAIAGIDGPTVINAWTC